jgi:GNAT superfamily N-acetyltransferase
MYLEDLFVREKSRGKGAGSMLFDTVRELARERECGRMEWTVLDWNEIALDFYAAKGAELKEEWLLCRIEP